MRKTKTLSSDLEYFERYLATQHVIKPLEVKRILKRLITKSKLLEINQNRKNYVKGRGNIREQSKERKPTSQVYAGSHPLEGSNQ